MLGGHPARQATTADWEYVFRPDRLWSARYTKDTSMKKRSSGRRRMPSSIAEHSEFADAVVEGTAATSPVERPAIPTTFGSALEEYQFLDRQHGSRVHIDPNDAEAIDRYERMQKLWPMVQDETSQERLKHAISASQPEDVEHALELMSTLASGLRTFGFRQKASNALDALLVGNENYCLLERLEIIHKGYWIEVYKLANDIRFDFFASYKPGKEAYSKEKQQEHARLLEAYVEEMRQSAAIVHGKPETDTPTTEGSEPETPTDEKQTREQRERAFDEAIAGYDPSKWKRDPDLNNKAWRVRSGKQKGELFGDKASERGWYQSNTRKQVIKKDENGVWVCLTASHSKKLEIFLGLFDS